MYMSPDWIEALARLWFNHNVEMWNAATWNSNVRSAHCKKMMRTLKYLPKAWVVAVAAVWGVAQSQATTTFTINNGGLETFNLTWDGTTENALAGGISMTRVGDVGIPSFVTVCTDIGGTVYLGQNYVYSDPTVFNNQSGIRPSWGAGNAGMGSLSQANASAAIQAAADIFFHHQGVLTTGSITDRAALQLAVWEALYDTTAGSSTLDLGTGRFTVNSGADALAISTAASWIAAVDANAEYAGFLLIPDPESQHGLVAQEVFYNITPVPEPTTLIAGALLLLPFGASTLRFVRKSRTA
jgi:hypothetical protein